MPSLVIPRGKWDQLSPEEKAAAKKLGITPEPETKPKEKKLIATKQPTYTLGLVVECTLCQEVELRVYSMQQSELDNAPFLQAIRIQGDNPPTPDKWESRKIPTCKYCRGNLKTLSKHDLISKLLDYADSKAATLKRTMECKN